MRQAKRRRRKEVETDHILLGLIHYDKEAEVSIFDKFNLQGEAIRILLTSRLPKGSKAFKGKPLFAPSAKRAIAFANREAGHKKTTPADLILGVMQDSESNGAKVLIELGLTLADARVAVAKIKDESMFHQALDQSLGIPLTAEDLLSAD